MELQNIHRVAVFKMRNIGDVLMSTPVLRALRETFPEAKITVVVNSGTEAMLAGNPHIDDIIVYSRPSPEGRPGLSSRLSNEWSFLRELRRRRFDLTIGLTDGDRAAWSSFFSGARYRLGAPHYKRRKYDPLRFIYNLRAPSSLPRMHEVVKHFYLLEKAGLKLRTTEPGPLHLEVRPEARDWARRQLEDFRDDLVVHVHPVARWLWKCWGNEAMAEVIDWLQEERGARVVVTTGPVARERQRAQEIVALCRRRPLFFDGDLSLQQIAALSAEADLFFGVDTAPMHMAAAVGTPVVALFGPTVPEVWAPWTEEKCVLRQPCACNQRRARACDWNQIRACLAAISPEEAKTALDRMLSRARAAHLAP